ncbi:MAG: DNA-3-methyladenine glycosylase 2 family protein [Pontimonas sp.]|nr:DNA-3-methyladenine glycosylase 2 family protein [Pontimonas sp.]
MTHQQAEALAYLQESCEVIAQLAQVYTPPVISAQPPERYFEILVTSIIGQQLSVKAADTIEARLRQAVDAMTPEGLAGQDIELLRGQGLSYSKANYIQGLAEAFGTGVIDPHALAAMDPPEVISALTALKGIGPWTAEMFLIFGMGHPDIWSPGDLGLRKAVEAHFGTEQTSSEVARRWAPYRSYAALYLWEYVDKGEKPIT